MILILPLRSIHVRFGSRSEKGAVFLVLLEVALPGKDTCDSDSSAVVWHGPVIFFVGVGRQYGSVGGNWNPCSSIWLTSLFWSRGSGAS